MNRVCAALVCSVLAPSVAVAIEPFTVKDIRVEGLQRIAAGTVFNYLPIKIGDTVTERGAQDAIRALYKTGFFKDVRLERQGQVLIVSVAERSSVASFRIVGTREFSEEDLKKALKEIGLAEGRIFNQSLLDRVEQELRTQYFSRGFYAVDIKPTITPLERNRVGVNIAVTEGAPARIREITLVGNREFDDRELRKLFTLGPAPWWAFFSSRDQYSKQKLAGDLERVRNFYQDRGFLEFNIDSTQVSISPDKEDIYITVNVSEGKRYTVADVKLSGKFVVPREELQALLSVKPGQVFSRREVTESTKRIADRLANDGYAFANINAVPDVDKEQARVGFNVVVDPGRRTYVRRVTFAGNASTRDEVLRREMRQMEGAWYSADKIQRSRVRLQRLGFFDDVNVETPAAAGTTDQVDMNVRVKERATGNLLFGVGYSDAQGVLINASITQNNLFGTGKELTVRADNSLATNNFSVRYVNPYYTPAGVSRGFTVFSTSVDAGQLNIAAYDTKTVGAGVFYGIPLTEINRLNLGFDLEQITIDTRASSAQVAQDFVAREGSPVGLVRSTVGWSSDSLDSTLFPTRGGLQRVNAEVSVPGSDIEYYRLTYIAGRYWPLTDTVSLKLRGEIDYGDGYGSTDELPFFKNFFAGGSSTVRGYRARSLGPRDERTNDPIGGDRRVLVNTELQFPVPGAADNKSLRMGVFVDGGTAYAQGQRFDLGELRYSAGLAFNWFSPIAPLSFSYAVPLNDKPGDETESFQFTLGVPFR